MNDIVLKTAEFFFVPEAILSVVFLIVFVGIFAFGVHRQRKCKEFLTSFDSEADENFKALITKMTPDMFIKKNLRKLSVSEDIIDELPNVFVSIGIVATFLGLGVAIQGAAELLQTDKLELPKLTAVLGVIAFKFQTSVWGICFSIIFRNIIVERYFEFRWQLIDELTDRLYMLERESARTLLERQNELLVIQHKEILDANALHNQSVIDRLTTFESTVQEDNRIANENLRYLAENFKDFVEVAQNFAEHELAFSKSVDAFSQRVKLFQEEFSTLVHEELADIKAINEGLGRIHAEHIQKIHDEHAANIFYTTQELDKLHQKFYLDAERFTKESYQTLDKLLEDTLGQVHNEYTREAHEISTVIGEVKSILSTIQENVAEMNQEFVSEQKQFASSWQVATKKVSATMDAFSIVSVKESEQLDTTRKILESVAKKMQSDYTDNLERINTLTQNAADNFQMLTVRLIDMQEDFSKTFKTLMEKQDAKNATYITELSAKSQATVEVAKAMQENLSQLTLNNRAVTEKLSGELVAVRDALENLTSVVDEERTALKIATEQLSLSQRKLVPIVSPLQTEEKSSSLSKKINLDKNLSGRYKK